MSEHQSIDTPAVRRLATPEEELGRLQSRPELNDTLKSFTVALATAERVRDCGGRAFLVGGAVRDELLGVEPKDFDLEVHGLSVEELETLLAKFDITESVGKSFGTYKAPASVGQVEVALPRRDSQFGNKHNENAPELLPDLGVTEAARRREFTIGAIYKDILTGDIYDPYGGVADLEAKILRFVDQKTFADDALRIFRGAGFVGRFGLTVEPETLRAMRSMVEKVGALAKERLSEEWRKILIKGRQPSKSVQVLREAGVLERWYPELERLWSTPQNPQYHPEGDVGTHTMMVLDAAADMVRKEPLPDDQNVELMYGALLHDTGKPDTTKIIDGHLHAYGHEVAGVKPTEQFLQTIGVPPASIKRIANLVAEHLRPAELYQNRATITDRALRRMARDIGHNHVRALVVLAEADHRGRGPFLRADGTTGFPDTSRYRAWWLEQTTKLELHVEPELILWGRDLVESDRGWKAGPLVGEAVRLGKELAEAGMTREEILTIVDQSDTPEKTVETLRIKLQEVPPEN